MLFHLSLSLSPGPLPTPLHTSRSVACCTTQGEKPAVLSRPGNFSTGELAVSEARCRLIDDAASGDRDPLE